MAVTNNLGDYLKNIADEIRSVKGEASTVKYNAQNFVNYIHYPEGSRSVAPTQGQQTISPATGYDTLSKVVVSAIPTETHTKPSISINTGTGVITATHTISANKYQYAGTTSATTTVPVATFHKWSDMAGAYGCKVAASSTQSTAVSIASLSQKVAYDTTLFGSPAYVTAVRNTGNTNRIGVAIPIYKAGTYFIQAELFGGSKSILYLDWSQYTNSANVVRMTATSASAYCGQVTYTLDTSKISLSQSISTTYPLYISAYNGAGLSAQTIGYGIVLYIYRTS